jgi:putative oxidoreductase
MKSALALIGRILYALTLLVFGSGHFMNAKGMAGMVPIPGGVIWIYITGAGLIAAAISIIINKKAGLAGLLLGIMLLIFALTIHLPGISSGDEMKSMMSMGNLMKDIAMSGAAFYMAGTLKD